LSQTTVKQNESPLKDSSIEQDSKPEEKKYRVMELTEDMF